MTSTDGLSFIRAVSSRAPNLRILGYGLANVPDDIVAFAESGGTGYLLQDASAHELEAEVDRILHDDFVYPPRVVAHLVKQIAAVSRSVLTKEASTLSPREIQIVVGLRDGLSNKEIAHRLSISVDTVKNHVHNILTKLHLHRRSEVVHIFERQPTRP
jgi:DNA-binding NarL/FixJ family response regulator